MPKVVDIVIDGKTLKGVVGTAFLSKKGVKVSESLDGSSLNITSAQHCVSFALPRELSPAFRPILGLLAKVRFSADYSTGEKVRNSVVQVTVVEPRDDGGVDIVLSVNPNEAILEEPGTSGRLMPV